MGYSGASLTDLVDRLDQATQEAGHRLADSLGRHYQANIEKNTPVETHHLRSSYKRTPIEHGADLNVSASGVGYAVYVWTGRVFTEVEYAPFVDRGTGLWGPEHRNYIIKPKKPGGVLAFTPYTRDARGGVILDVHGQPTRSGDTVIVRFVMHPGSPGHHMFEIGAILTEAEKDEWSAEPLRLWKEMVEGRIL